ncbi:hypothetical protein R3P38DRAFT_3141708 [Favolaschia claudopus]|uniref:Uncharacterized protein n=1 Tax=Favolaschia claudopus TaxID=2862362 RepID=A0AAV9Z5C2_9AGAR
MGTAITLSILLAPPSLLSANNHYPLVPFPPPFTRLYHPNSSGVHSIPSPPRPPCFRDDSPHVRRDSQDGVVTPY